MTPRSRCAILTAGWLLALAGESALAQNVPVAPPARDPKACSEEQRLQPPTVGRPSGRSNETLSEKLERTEGVVCPPTGVDPEITVPPPGGGRTPVIPPPGSPGDRRSTKFVKGRLVGVDCSKAPTATLTVHSDQGMLKLRTADYKSLLLIGADDFSCEWRDRAITANYKSSGAGAGDLVSLEMR